VKLGSFTPFGHPVNEITALRIIGLLLLYNAVSYAFYAAADWYNWSNRLREDTYN